jgi:hypothetical protein
MAPKAPYLPYDALRKVAKEFLGRHNAHQHFPVPIEEIVDVDFGLDIVPMPGLHQAFDVDSFISNDLSEIRVDQFVYETRPGRYRFSLAHELSHRLIHAEVYREFRFSTIAEWKGVISSISDKDYRLLEWQANSLAGLILVPSHELAPRFIEAYDRVEAIGLDPVESAAIEAIESHLAAEFAVSPAVVHRRLEYDDHIQPKPEPN